MNRISSTRVPEEAFQFQFYSSPRPNEYRTLFTIFFQESRANRANEIYKHNRLTRLAQFLSRENSRWRTEAKAKWWRFATLTSKNGRVLPASSLSLCAFSR